MQNKNKQPYKKLYTFWYSVLIYDLTVEFCKKWIKSWKLKEQMEDAARSGKQNIVEGSDAMQTSLKTAIRLTSVSKSSIEELLGDLEYKHLKEGGYREQLYKKRMQYRKKTQGY